MMRVYHPVFAAVVKSIVLVQERLAAKKKSLRLLFSGRVAIDRQGVGTLCLVLVVSLLVTVSLSARHTIAGLAQKSQLNVASWMSSSSNPTKLLRSLADRSDRYGNFRSAHAAGNRTKTGNDVSLPPEAGPSVNGPIPVGPNMVPLPPDGPPTFTNPLEAGVTVQALHITELQDAVNLVRTRAGLPAFSWTLGAASGLPIKASHIQELRDRLDDVRIALGLSPASYSPPAPSVGGSIRAAHVLELRTQIIEMFNATGSANSTVARLDPDNRTGGGGADPLSRNFNWSVPLVGLPGRSGLDLGLSLSYNSLVWTKSGSFISFNDDHGFPSAGFRLGFPVIQPRYFNSEVGKWAYLLITPSGGRVELRQVGASNVYESADSSYLQMMEGAALTLLTTNGTRLSLSLINGEYRCTEVRDRNGNYLTVAYYGDGRIDKILDTLGRTITFIYDAYQHLSSITQPWKRQTEANPTGVDEVHTWATFLYTNLTLQPSFSSLTVIGGQPGTVIPVITQVALGDGSYYKLSYNEWGQVWKVTHYAADSVVGGVPQDTHALSHTRLNLPGSDLLAATPQTDCPRFTEKRTWIENGVMNQSEEVTTSYSPWTPNMASCEVTVPDGTIHKELYATSGWQRGLTTQSEVWSAGQRKKWTNVTWEHDGAVDAQFMTNPRVNDATVNDSNDKHRRTSVTFTSFGLPQEVIEYAANTTTPLRTTRTEYDVPNLSEYHSRRIIGLPNFQYLYEGTSASGTLVSKVGFVYDDTTLPEGYLNALPSAATQHDAASYGTGLRWRGNANRVRRYDVTGGAGSYVERQASYNVTGTVAFSKDAAGHKISVNYADAFYQGVNRSNPVLPTFAYPTTVTDPGLFTSSTWYNYDMGVVTESETPLPNEVTDLEGPKLKRLYDSAGRTIQVTNSFNAARTKWVYPSSNNLVQTFTLLDVDVEPDLETYSASYLDGIGRVRASARELPSSTGGYSGQFFDYDSMGRLARQSSPTETTAAGNWPATGDDATAGWLYTQQSYDWNGRPLVTTNTDGTTKTASYDGCGCAGGEVVTLTDEGTIDAGVAKRRQQKIYSDVLGRTVKTETLNWEGGSIYSTMVNTYNARDQLTLVRQYQGGEGSGVYQDTTLSYDGHGRLQTRHAPEQNTGTATTYAYNPDDTINLVTDARGATCTYGYNARHQVTSKIHALSQSTISDSYAYDAAGNRKSMSDGTGSTTFDYDQLSRMNWEERTFNALSGAFRLTYGYNLAGLPKSITDPAGATINYTFDSSGQTTAVTGSSFGAVTEYATNMKYRAWGAIKEMSYENSHTVSASYNARLQPTHFEIPGVIAKDYQYTADGRLRYSGDLLDNRFDRSYSFDHAGRIKEAFSGPLARGEADTSNRPYKEFHQYDAMDHLVGRVGSRHWSQPLPNAGVTDSYVNNRNPNWQYDADGRLTNGADIQSTFDVAGRATTIVSNDGDDTQTRGFDGDGRLSKLVEVLTQDDGGGPFTTTTTRYSVFSSVVGKVITEVDETGQKRRSFVYNGGDVLAWQQKSGSFEDVWWEYRDPSDASYRMAMANSGTDSDRFAEMDPLGSNAGLFNPYTQSHQHWPGEDGIYPGFADLSNPDCQWNGMPFPCEAVDRFIQGGAASMDYLIFDGRQWQFDGKQGREHIPIVPAGLGMFVTGSPYLRRNNEWRPGDSLEIRWSEFLNVSPQTPTPQESTSIDPNITKQAYADCISELYPQYAMVGFTPTKAGANGVTRIRDVATGTEANIVSDSTPPADVAKAMFENGARGATPSNNPWWTYATTYAADPELRPGEKRYPELYLASGMDYVRTQFHEAAAALTLIRNMYHPGPWAPLPNNLDPNHGDDGPAMEDCVGRKVYGKLGLKPGN